MAMKNAAQVAQKWSQNLAGATQAITNGVNAVTVAPGQAAAAQAQVAGANYAAKIADGSWAAAVAAVPLSTWQQAMIKKGLPNLANGAAMGQTKMQNFMNQLLPHVQQAVASLPPRGTKQQNRQRMLAFSDAMMNFKKQPG